MSDAKKENKENKEKKSKLPVIIIGLLVIMLIGGGAFGFYYIKSIKSAAPEKIEEVQQAIGEFTVNLADEGGKKYLKLNIIMTYNGGNKKLTEELAKQKNDLQDMTLRTLRSKKTVDLNGKGYDDLKVELINNYNNFLKEGKIIKVTFTSFIVQ